MNARINLLFATALFGCLMTAGGADNNNPPKTMSIQITSTAFAEGQPIPAKYSCEGSDISPPLQWIPQGGRPQTPRASHSSWTIPTRPSAPGCTGCSTICRPNTTGLPEDVAKTPVIPGGAKQGLNSWPRLGYGGPCPPPGKPHRYFFKIYALDKMLDLKPGATKKDIVKPR